MATHIATLFDKKYVLRALSLYESSQNFLQDSQFWFLCLDQESYDLINRLNLKNSHLKKVDDIGDEELLKTRLSRSVGEFAFTAKSSFVFYIFESGELKPNDMMIWVDADILFYSGTQNFVDQLQNTCSIGISPHRFSKEKEKQVGRYNAGMIFFKNDEHAKKCLQEWKKQCIKSCFVKPEEGMNGDQTYLDYWHQKYTGVCDITHKGVNLGTWNINKYKITKDKNGNFFVDNEPLICYHFHGLNFYIDKNDKIRPYPINVYHDEIYKIYTESLQKAYKKILSVDPNWKYEFAAKPDVLRRAKQRILKMFR